MDINGLLEYTYQPNLVEKMRILAWLPVALVLSFLGAGSAFSGGIERNRAGQIGRVIISSCDHCLSSEDLARSAKTQFAQDSGLLIGTVEWYTGDLPTALREAAGKIMSDMTFEDWKIKYDAPVYLWAQAIKLGSGVGLRVCSQEGGITNIDISGPDIFHKLVDGHTVELLDVRISGMVGIADYSVFVHLLTDDLPTEDESRRICRQYLASVGPTARHIECVLGPDEIRPVDNRYLVHNPFHAIRNVPRTRQELKGARTCDGPRYEYCY